MIHYSILFLYPMFGGFIGRMIWARNRRNMGCWPPPKCNSSGILGHDFINHHGPGAVLSGIFWPLMIPICCGAFISDFLTHGEEREAKRKAAHERKLAELEANRQLKEAETQKTLADIQFLVENGIHADVPGLYEEK